MHLPASHGEHERRVESAQLGSVGTCALMKIDAGVYELTKLGALEQGASA